MIDQALEMLRQGKRPTLDLLLERRGGGSRSTAQQALTLLYTERLPAMLAQQQGDLPEALLSAVRHVWDAAQTAASATAEVAIAQAHGEVKNLQAKLHEQLQAIEQERETARAEVEAAHAFADNAEAVARAAESAQEEVEVELAALRERHDALQGVCEQQRKELTASQRALESANESRRQEIEQAALRLLEAQEAAARNVALMQQAAEEARRALATAHGAAMSELKTAYVESETRLRLELDGIKSRCKQLDAEVERLRGRLSEADTALALAAQREEAAKRVRRPWLRPGSKPSRKR